jgi:hypothetical protein
MNAQRDKEHVRLTFNLLEARILRQILDELIANYAVPPDEMDAKGASVWYSTRGCETAKMTAEETRDWLEQLHGFRSANLALLQEWSRQLARRQEGHFALRVPLAEAATLVGVLNDHRLLVAARNDIGQTEMDLAADVALKQLTARQQTALFEIHLLGWMIEELLRLIAPEAAAWMD